MRKERQVLYTYINDCFLLYVLNVGQTIIYGLYGLQADLLNVVDKDLLELENQVRFFNEFRERTINLDDGKKREELYDELKVKGYPALPKEAVSEPSTENDYHYLTSMISSMGIDDEYENQVRAEYFSKISELDMLTYSSPKDLWLQDLDALEVQLKVSFVFLREDFFISFFLGFFKS